MPGVKEAAAGGDPMRWYLWILRQPGRFACAVIVETPAAGEQPVGCVPGRIEHHRHGGARPREGQPAGKVVRLRTAVELAVMELTAGRAEQHIGHPLAFA